MYPDRDTLSNVPSGYITARDQSMMKSGVTGGGKNTASFLFSWMNATTQTRQVSSLKATIFKVIPEEKQQLVEEKDADNIRKVLFKSFIQWFWELDLCCYKYRVDCFGSLHLLFFCYLES